MCQVELWPDIGYLLFFLYQEDPENQIYQLPWYKEAFLKYVLET